MTDSDILKNKVFKNEDYAIHAFFEGNQQFFKIYKSDKKGKWGYRKLIFNLSFDVEKGTFEIVKVNEPSFDFLLPEDDDLDAIWTYCNFGEIRNQLSINGYRKAEIEFVFTNKDNTGNRIKIDLETEKIIALCLGEY